MGRYCQLLLIRNGFHLMLCALHYTWRRGDRDEVGGRSESMSGASISLDLPVGSAIHVPTSKMQFGS